MNNFKAAFRNYSTNRGFVLPIVLTMGTIMMLVGVAAIARSQNTRLNAFAREQTTGGSLIVAEGGVARTLSQLTKANNRVLLTRDYDSINSQTGKTYLGADGILNTGDEEETLVDGWASANTISQCNSSSANGGIPNIDYQGRIGDSDTYTIKAYRYNNVDSTGTLLIEGKRKNLTSFIKVTIALETIASDFPGIVATERMEILGRNVIGSNGNTYYDPSFSRNPSLTADAATYAPNRQAYLNAIKSGIDDGYTVDNIQGKIVACKLKPTFAYSPQGKNLGTLKKTGVIFGELGKKITYYQANKIELDKKIVAVDTTHGAIYIYVNGAVKIKGNSQIINFRTDGTPPKVGDLRIIVSTRDNTQIDGTACIQNAFFYAPQGNFTLNSDGDGCPSSGNTNIDGVVWAREIRNNSNSDAGIAVPDDLSSLSDIVDSVSLPATKKFGSIKTWQRQQL